jgi:hypothetical protein
MGGVSKLNMGITTTIDTYGHLWLIAEEGVFGV